MWAWIVSLGAWNWFILAALLFLLEVLAPGMFMLWLGLAAILVGAIATFVAVPWQLQLIAFAAFAIASVPAWRYFARKVEKPADSPSPRRRLCRARLHPRKADRRRHRCGAHRRHGLARHRAGLPGRQPGEGGAHRRGQSNGRSDLRSE
jgi:hypothetical protein